MTFSTMLRYATAATCPAFLVACADTGTASGNDAATAISAQPVKFQRVLVPADGESYSF